jgi:CRISPR-associated endoribonuclease Cas6
MIKITLDLENLYESHIPNSDGYILYSCILDLLSKEVANDVHSADHNKLHISSLSGKFGRSSRRGKKKLLEKEKYSFDIVILSEEDKIEKDVKKSLLLGDDYLQIAGSKLEVRGSQIEKTKPIELIELAEKKSDKILVSMEDPTVLRHKSTNITETFPRRENVFLSLLNKWNSNNPSLKLDIDKEEILENVFSQTKGNESSYKVHNVVVKHNDKKNIKRHGITGQVIYNLSKSREDVKNSIKALAQYSNYSGIGEATSRGLGTTKAEFIR